MAEEGHTSLYAFCLGGVGAHQVAAPVEGPGSGRSGGKAGGLLPRRPRTAAGPSAEEDPAPHQGALSRWRPSPATAGGDFLELVLGKAVFRRGRAIITAESSMRLLGSWLQSWEALRRGLGGGAVLLAVNRPLGSSDNTAGDRGGLGSLLVPGWLKCSLGRPPAARSLGRALQQLLPPARVTEELQFPGEQLHLHGHRFVLLTVDAEGAPGALCRGRRLRTARAHSWLGFVTL